MQKQKDFLNRLKEEGRETPEVAKCAILEASNWLF